MTGSYELGSSLHVLSTQSQQSLQQARFEPACSAGPPISEQHATSKFPLLAPALQGLVRFSHMISMEYFADILACLLGLIRAPGLPLRLRLSCLLCASDIHK